MGRSQWITEVRLTSSRVMKRSRSWCGSTALPFPVESVVRVSTPKPAWSRASIDSSERARKLYWYCGSGIVRPGSGSAGGSPPGRPRDTATASTRKPISAFVAEELEIAISTHAGTPEKSVDDRSRGPTNVSYSVLRTTNYLKCLSSLIRGK